MQHLDLDYEDVSATTVTGRPTTDLHDLRAVLVSTDPVVARRVERILTPMGARLAVIPDWGHVSIAEIRGLDPQLVLLEPHADLKSRADANRRLAEEPRLQWAVIDRVPRGLESQAGVDRLIELAAVALGADRQLQAEIVLAKGGEDLVAPIDALGPGRLLRALVLTEGAFVVRYDADAVRASLIISGGALVEATWEERSPEVTTLTGVAALTAFTALRQGDVTIAEIAPRDESGLGLLANTLEEAAAPELNWVATRVATGRYLYPPPGAEKSLVEGDLPEASRTRRERPEGMITTEMAPIAGSATMPGVAGLPAVLLPEMPRMPRPQGPKPLLENVEREESSPLEVAISSIVNLLPDPGQEPGAMPLLDGGEYDDMEPSSLNLDVEVEIPETVAAPVVIPETQAMPIAEAPSSLHSDVTLPPREEKPAPVSVWPNEPAPVSAADSIRPSLMPVQIPKRRIWPWALAALALLGLVAGGGAVALLAPTMVADYAGESTDLFAQIEGLNLDGESEAATSSAPAGSSVTAEATPSISTLVEPSADEAAEMVFDLEETHEAGDADADEAAPSPRRRRRATRRQVRTLLDQAHDAPSAEAATVLYHEALELEPREVRAMRGLARAHMVMGDYATAVRFAEEATRTRPRDAESWGLLGDIHRRAGHAESAQRAYDRAAALDPEARSEVAEPSDAPADEIIDPADEPTPAAQAAIEPEIAEPTEAEVTEPQTPRDPPGQLAPRRPGAGLPPAL